MEKHFVVQTRGSSCLLPLLIVANVSNEVIVKEIRAGDALISSQNDNQDITTINVPGMYI